MSQKIRVDIWSDLICPWCWIGRRRFENVLEKLGESERFEVHHRAFRLAPGESVGKVEKALADRYGKSHEDVLRMLKHVEHTAAKDGLEYHLDGTLFGDTVDGHRLVLWAAGKGRQHDVLEALSKAYFTEKKSIFDHQVLATEMKTLGFEEKEVLTFLQGQDLRNQVQADEEQARAFGASGVPFFVFANQFAISGAQPESAFQQALEEILAQNEERE